MRLLKLVVLLMVMFTVVGQADTFSINAENDLFASNNTDKYYTHGSRISYLDKTRDSWIDFDNNLLFGSEEANEYSLGQNMYTPDNISIIGLQPYDRPYAGLLYGEIAHIKYDKVQNSRIGYVFGIVGKESFAEEAQTFFHDTFGYLKPKGWANQINTEPILNLQYTYKYKIVDGGWFDIVPRVEAAFGNAHILCGTGVDFRIGYNMKDWEYSIMEPSPRNEQWLSCYLLVGTVGRFVARNITLDGNTFRDSHSVDKEEVVSDFYIGGGLRIKMISIEYRFTNRTDEFEGQGKQEEFGSIAIRIDV
jgi:hypothetical protein